jgi:hypothetical protein
MIRMLQKSQEVRTFVRTILPSGLLPILYLEAFIILSPSYLLLGLIDITIPFVCDRLKKGLNAFKVPVL